MSDPSDPLPYLPPPPPPSPPPPPVAPPGWGGPAAFGGPPQYSYATTVVASTPRRSGKAIAALVLGLCSILLFGTLVVPLLALIFGLIGAGEVRRSPATVTGIGMARAGWILGVLGLCGFVAVVFVAVRDRSDNVLGGDDAADIGTCFNLPDAEEDFVSDPDITAVACDGIHDGELFHRGELNPDADRVYPGQDNVFDEAARLCAAEPFENYVGLDYNLSTLDVYVLIPEELGWNITHGGFECYVYDPSGAPLIGSVRDSGR